MIRDRFSYHAPDSVEEAVGLLSDGNGDTTVLAGGTWLVWEMHRGLRRPTSVVDLRRVGLAGVEPGDGQIVIGATTPYAAVEADPRVPALLRTMARGITGGAQIRNQGTLGGALCYANPSSDVPAALVALGATLHLQGSDGRREVAAADFVRGPFATALEPGELLTAIVVPSFEAGTSFGYEKFKMSESSWPIVTAGCVLGPDGDLHSLAVGGATGAPVAVPVDRVAEPAELVDRTREAIVDPYSDVHADGGYRRHVAGVIAARAVRAAAADHEAGGAGS